MGTVKFSFFLGGGCEVERWGEWLLQLEVVELHHQRVSWSLSVWVSYQQLLMLIPFGSELCTAGPCWCWGCFKVLLRKMPTVNPDVLHAENSPFKNCSCYHSLWWQLRWAELCPPEVICWSPNALAPKIRRMSLYLETASSKRSFS